MNNTFSDSSRGVTPGASAPGEGRDRTRTALLKVAAHEFSRFGCADSVLARVENKVQSSPEDGPTAGDLSAGAVYARPELYHLFRSKEELALAVVQWMEETWYEEVGYLLANETDPVGALLAVARGHAHFSPTVLPVVMALSTEFEGRDHPVLRAVNQAHGRFIGDTVRLIKAGRRSGAIPPGPPPKVLALAYLGALNSIVNTLRGHAPYDAQLAEKVALGVLGLAPASDSAGTG